MVFNAYSNLNIATSMKLKLSKVRETETGTKLTQTNWLCRHNFAIYSQIELSTNIHVGDSMQ